MKGNRFMGKRKRRAYTGRRIVSAGVMTAVLLIAASWCGYDSPKQEKETNQERQNEESKEESDQEAKREWRYEERINNGVIKHEMINNGLINRETINHEAVNNKAVNQELVNNGLINNGLIDNRLINNELINNERIKNRPINNKPTNDKLLSNALMNNKFIYDKVISSEISEEEKNLLKKISVDEAAIDQGVLAGWQGELLQIRREALHYLKGKYPSHTFQITDARGADPAGNGITFWFLADGEEKRRYVLYVTTDNGQRVMRDTLSGALLEGPYERALFSWLQKRIPECVGCRVFFDGAAGADYTEGHIRSVVQALFDGSDHLSNITELYLDGQSGRNSLELAEEAKQNIRRKRLYGAYEIYVFRRLPEDFKENAETGREERQDSYLKVQIDKNRFGENGFDKNAFDKYTFSCFE